MPETVENVMFLHRSHWIPVCVSQEIVWFMENLRNPWKKHVFSLQSWQRVTATQGGSQRTVRDHARIPLKTLDFLVFPDGPQPKNDVRLEMPLVPRAESYG